MEFIQPTTVAASTGPGSHVVKANGWVYISGQVALNENGEVVGRGDIHAQVEQTLKNLKACVEAAGGTLHDVVELVIYMQNIADYRPAVTDARLRYFGTHRPASTVIGATLGHPDLLLEIKAVAYVSR